MVVLKKIKSSSLTEVLIATTIILVVFGIATITINNLLTSFYYQNSDAIVAKLTELQYKYKNNQILIPYKNDYKGWKINIYKSSENPALIILRGEHMINKKIITNKMINIEAY